ncbi:MAG TPA: CDP-diacylglycerol--glycerol-3-phosphate 3-phosphatidyltransferase [Planctomycetota bacterium]
MNLPNKITSGRFVFTILFLATLGWGSQRNDPRLLTAAFVLFQIAAWTDLLDGYLARKYQQVTHFGRIADPLVDKILVCGAFIFFLTIEPLDRIFSAWFTVVVLGREFLVSGIRGAAEAAGIPFPASVWGKIKTFIQNLTVGWGVGHAAWIPDSRWSTGVLTALMWGSLAATVISGATYVMGARRLLGSGRI